MIGALVRGFALLLLLHGATALAHKPSDSYLALSVDGATVDGQWDIALRDLDAALGLDADGDGAITWGEVRARHADIAAYALSRLTLRAAGAPCAATAREHLIDRHTDGAYAVLRFSAACPSAPSAIDIDYRLLFDIDPQHRGLLKLSSGGIIHGGIFAADTPTRVVVLAETSRLRQFVDYAGDGVAHIFLGFDHILFLLSLLLPAVLVRVRTPAPAWRPAPNFRDAFREVFKVVTAFTVAHSITLSLAVLGAVSLPSRLVESAIAVSVILAALNNLRPVVGGGRWMFAFAFGLVHGFGFASVLAGLGLPQEARLLALVAFNVGVELGQLAIVLAFLPLAFALRGTTLYRRGILAGGSVLVAILATGWLVERAFDITLRA